MPRFTDTMTRGAKLKIGAAALLAIGVAGGAGAVSLTRPSIEMAPTTPTAIAKLPASSGVVTVKGRIAEVYGDRFVLQDASGRTMIDAGRDADAVSTGTTMTVQGRYDNGQLRASYLVDPAGRIDAVGPAGKRPPHHPGGPDGGPSAKGPGRDGPGRDGPGRDGPAEGPLAGNQAGCAPMPVAAALPAAPATAAVVAPRSNTATAR